VGYGLLARRRIGESMRGTGGPMRGSGRMMWRFLRKARAVVWSIDPPWVAKLNSRPAYDTKSLVLCALLKVKMDYRSISSYLKANPDLLRL
jgi:hypothetical protein